MQVVAQGGLWSSQIRSLDTDQLTGKVGAFGQSVMDSNRQAGEVWIYSTDYDPRMARTQLVQTDEVLPIERHQNPVLCGRERQYFLIRECLAALSRVLRSQNVMPQPSKLIDGREREILIRI